MRRMVTRPSDSDVERAREEWRPRYKYDKKERERAQEASEGDKRHATQRGTEGVFEVPEARVLRFSLSERVSKDSKIIMMQVRNCGQDGRTMGPSAAGRTTDMASSARGSFWHQRCQSDCHGGRCHPPINRAPPPFRSIVNSHTGDS